MAKKIEEYQIISKLSELRHAVGFNDSNLKNTQYSLSLDQFEKRIQHQMGLVEQVKHTEYQLSNYYNKCSNCDLALTCSTKCIL